VYSTGSQTAKKSGRQRLIGFKEAIIIKAKYKHSARTGVFNDNRKSGMKVFYEFSAVVKVKFLRCFQEFLEISPLNFRYFRSISRI
jgi:hypothetical protein